MHLYGILQLLRIPFRRHLPSEVWIPALTKKAVKRRELPCFFGGELGGGFKYFLCLSLPGEMIPFD